ncbi:MAG: hypothetical protein QGH45_16340 [Myxococcota bacterium]|nr:hypothetical protein [Myxococcota bacterium]
MLYAVFENEAKQTPSLEDLNYYAIEHDISYPLLVDSSQSVYAAFEQDYSIPSVHVFSPGPTVEILDGAVTEADVLALLD